MIFLRLVSTGSLICFPTLSLAQLAIYIYIFFLLPNCILYSYKGSGVMFQTLIVAQPLKNYGNNFVLILLSFEEEDDMQVGSGKKPL